MPKILCLSDTHVGAGHSHRQDALADTDAMFAQVVDLAVERGVDLCLHAGDPFHRAKPTPAELHCFRRFTAALAQAEIPMIALDGNGAHSVAPGQESALELFASPLVTVSRRPEVHEVAGVAIATLPAVPLNRLVAARNGGDRAELYEEAIDLLLRTARDLFESAPSDRPRLLVAHHMVSGATLPTGLPVDAVGSLVLPLHELEEIGFDAIVLGDIHKAQVLSDEPFTAYCGAPMRNDFGEGGNEVGVWLLETSDEAQSLTGEPIIYTNTEFVSLEDRSFVTVDVDLTEGGDWKQRQADSPRSEKEGSDPGLGDNRRGSEVTIESALVATMPTVPDAASSYSLDETDAIAASIAAHLPLREAVVRVRVTATEEQWRRVDVDALNRMLADAGVHKVYGGIQWLPVREHRARASGMDESLSVEGAIALYCDAQGVVAEDASSLQALAVRWLGEMA